MLLLFSTKVLAQDFSIDPPKSGQMIIKDPIDSTRLEEVRSFQLNLRDVKKIFKKVGKREWEEIDASKVGFNLIIELSGDSTIHEFSISTLSGIVEMTQNYTEEKGLISVNESLGTFILRLLEKYKALDLIERSQLIGLISEEELRQVY